MNWIEIDKLLLKIIDRHATTSDMIAEAKKHFNWTHAQAESAIVPLIKRHKKDKK